MLIEKNLTINGAHQEIEGRAVSAMFSGLFNQSCVYDEHEMSRKETAGTARPYILNQ